MDKAAIKVIERMIYDFDDESLSLSDEIFKIYDSEMLHVIAYNYNWDDGFDVPIGIYLNPYCSLSTALLLFYNAEEIGTSDLNISL